MDLGPFVDHDQRAFELAHVLGVDSEIGLQGEFDLHARRDVDKRPARPDGRVEGRELVVLRRNDFREMLSQQVGMLAQGRVGVGEDNALLAQLVFERSVDHLALELGLHAGEELLLRLGDTQLVERLFDLRGHVVPTPALVVGRFEVVVDILEIDGDVAAPLGRRLRLEDSQAAQPKLAHPIGFVLDVGYLLDDFGIDTFSGLEYGRGLRTEIVFVDFANRVGRFGSCCFGCHVASRPR